VTSDQTDRVFVFDGDDGAPLGEFGDGPGAGVDGATYLEWLPDPELRLQRPWPGTAGVSNDLGVTNATPAAPLWLVVGFDTTSLPLSCPGAWLGVDPALVLTLVADGAGAFALSAAVPADAVDGTLVMQAYDPSSGCLSNLVICTFD
jgi:hypothetical protein